MKIIGYVRVSTDSQADSGLGIEAQIDAIEKYAKKLQVKIEQIFIDEGVSGKLSHEDRPKMIAAIEALNKGDIFLVAKRDRLGRDDFALAMIERAIVQIKKARIVSAAGEGTENDSASSILMRRMIDAFAEFERQVISERTKAALKIKKDKGERVGYIPFGYQLNKDGANLIKEEKEQRILGKIKSLIKKGLSIRETAAVCNNQKLFNRGNSKWNHASMHRIFKKLKLKQKRVMIF